MHRQELEPLAAASAQGFHRYPDYDPNHVNNKPHAGEKWLLNKLLTLIGSPPVRFVLWDGQEIVRSAAPVASILIRDRGALLKLVANPDLQFGEMYCAGRIEVAGSLVEFLEALYTARPNSGPGGLRRTLLNWANRPRPNDLLHARNNIHHHYDIGNDFYRLWLDEQMLYTCAYFTNLDETLEQAQIAKMDHICRKLELKPGQRVVEAGCGWGALALHMAKHYGVEVKAYNIAREQLAYAREMAQRAGLSQQIEYIEGDFREIASECDAFVSVGMLEHVGLAHYPALGAVIDRCLSPVGRGLIHTIGTNRPTPLNPWIERHIFPGAYPPSLCEMMQVFEPKNFSVLDVENLRLHYAKTLEHWLQRFETAIPQVTKMADESFVRTWRLYLAGSLGAFSTGELQLFQVVFARGNDNDIPWTRDFLYAQDKDHGTL
jgi:cyclopropane-fatty-acyl-phospholipid synthase